MVTDPLPFITLRKPSELLTPEAVIASEDANYVTGLIAVATGPDGEQQRFKPGLVFSSCHGDALS